MSTNATLRSILSSTYQQLARSQALTAAYRLSAGDSAGAYALAVSSLVSALAALVNQAVRS